MFEATSYDDVDCCTGGGTCAVALAKDLRYMLGASTGGKYCGGVHYTAV